MRLTVLISKMAKISNIHTARPVKMICRLMKKCFETPILAATEGPDVATKSNPISIKDMMAIRDIISTDHHLLYVLLVRFILAMFILSL